MKSTSWSRIGFVALVGLMVCSSFSAAGASENSITVVSGHSQNTSSDGLSLHVKFKGRIALFCAGCDTGPLLQNLAEMGLAAAPIDAVVLSDNHSHHYQGLTGVLSAAENPPKVFSSTTAAQEISRRNPQADVVAVTKPTRVLPGAWLVGPMHLEHEGETVAEYVLVLDQPDGLVVIVECSRPDIISVVEQVKEVFGYRKIKLIAGAVHLRETRKKDIKEISLRLQQMGIKSLALSSCAGEPALKVLRQEWGDRVVSFDPGDTIDF